MKNNGLIITMIILLSIIVICLIAFLCVCITGRFNYFSGFSFKRDSGKVIYDETYDVSSINNIDILCDITNVEFRENSDNNVKVVVYGGSNSSFNVDLVNNKLDIDFKQRGFKLFSFGGNQNSIVVYIPKTYNNEINIDCDCGNVDIISLDDSTINVKADCGNVNLGNVKNVNIDANLGDIDISLVLNKLNIDSDCGSIKIDKVDLKENSYIKSDLGDVKINGTNDIFIDADVDLGDVKVNNNNRYSDVTLKIEADCGNVKVNN